jgi:hypothetical protein
MTTTLLSQLAWVALIGSASAAQLPYTPTSILASQNGSIAYLFSPQSGSSQCALSVYNTSGTVDPSYKPTELFSTLPFLSSSVSKAFVPLVDDRGITVLTGNCSQGAQGAELWRLSANADITTSSWQQLKVSSDDNTLAANYLSAGLAFPGEDNTASDLYVFGGMCPNETNADSSWVANANYSAVMLALSPQSLTDAASPYTLSATGSRAPPIPEAGLTMTPLTPAFVSAGQSSQQQNFVLLGGHTQNAFINMSQVALFTLPQASWAFIPVAQPASADKSELVRRDAPFVEPRSGHTAVLTEDGTKIIVVGGWVGDTNTAAQPQVAILNIGQGYGGSGNWAWSVPDGQNPFGSSSGLYGHGATLLQGGVMVIAGGININGGFSKAKRQSSNGLHFLNTTSMQWSNSYAPPSSASLPEAHGQSGSTGLSDSEKIGVGAGIGVSVAVIAVIVSVWFWYTRRLRNQRNMREKELRALALGAERQFDSMHSDQPDEKYPERRSASWANMQEKALGSFGLGTLPWATGPGQGYEHDGNTVRQAERTGAAMDVPSPTRGLRRSLHSRGANSFNSYNPSAPGVFRIDEEEENSQSGSLRRARTPKAVGDRSSQYSDPFKDPPPTADSTDPAAERRRREVQGWVEDWQSAAESMLSRNPSQAQTNRTYSNLSQAYSHSHSNSNSGGSGQPSGRGSPEKSDRTGSNLSEQSVYSQYSFQRSAGGISRNQSQRSASVGLTLFGGAAAAAMGRLGMSRNQDNVGAGISREPSKRSVSMREYGTSGPPMRERAETYSSARTSLGPLRTGEDLALLGKFGRPDVADDHSTPPTSPVKERDAKYTRTSSLTKTGAMAMGLLGSVKRVITGGGGPSVHDRVAAFENRSALSSPTKSEREESPKRPLSPSQEFWKGKQGARDWKVSGDVQPGESARPTGTIRRKPLPGQAQQEDGDWDVESAVQNRVVQVMFTVPKEKLRVVNADQLSLLSSNRSDVDYDDDKEREKEVKRMSSVREMDEHDSGWKGKEPDRG